MNGRSLRWTIAISGSLAVHAAAAIWLGAGADEVEIAGGARAEIAVLGNAFEDALAAGEVSEAIEPVQAEAAAAAPVENGPTVEAVRPAPIEPPQTAATKETAAPPAVAPSQAEPAEPAPDGVAIAALPPAEPASPNSSAQVPRSGAAVEPVEENSAPETPETAPRPTPRPERTVETADAQPPRKARDTRRPAEKAAPSRSRAGAGGNSGQSARRGSADGAEQAQAAKSGDAGRSREAGNAQVSNYPGQVFAKLRRSLRYPAEARRKRIRGEAHVRFTVSRSGSVGSVGLARSSGSPILDKAALETVRRAAPFPAIPAAAGRSSWSFTVPLAFTR